MRRSLILAYISIGVLCGIPLNNLAAQLPDGYECKGVINATLGQDCNYLLTPDQILSGGPALPDLKVFVFDKNSSDRGTVECPGFYNFTLTNENNAILCYGFIQVVDSSGPQAIDTIQTQDTLTCTLISTILNNPLTTQATIDGVPNKYYLGEVVFEENCSSCDCAMTSKFLDQVDFYPCDSLPYFARITREWTATDCNDLTTVVNQYFYLERPDFTELVELEDMEISTCEPDTVMSSISFPFWIDTFGDTLYLDELDCNLDIDIIDQNSSICEDTGIEINRIYRVLDWCNGTTTDVDTLTIRIGDFEQPILSGGIHALQAAGNAESFLDQLGFEALEQSYLSGEIPIISTGPVDCSAGLSLRSEDLESLFNLSVQDCGSDLNIEARFFTLVTEQSMDPRINPDQGLNPRDNPEWLERSYPVFDQMVGGLPPGVHAIELSYSDVCANQGKGVVFIEVQDNISPVARCPEDVELVLTPNNDFSVSLSATTLGENSFDNCSISLQRIRKGVSDLESCLAELRSQGLDLNEDGLINQEDFEDENENGIRDPNENGWELIDGMWYTPWSGNLDFSCCDQNQLIPVELQLQDSRSSIFDSTLQVNISSCVSTVKVINNTLPSLIAPAPQTLFCTDASYALLQEGTYSQPEHDSLLSAISQAFGAAQLEDDYCPNFIYRERIEPEMDQCGNGIILRIISVEYPSDFGVPLRDSVVQTLNVQARYDYWVRFPEDQTINCTADIPETGAVDYQGSNCDLLAVSFEDELFFAAETDGACYKIFRTFQVINWCEYDGQSSPVVLSRDWDNWNGENCGDQYNVNPQSPSGNDIPGDTPLYIHVKRNVWDDRPDTVYYDLDQDPYNQFPDNPRTTQVESYWWKVISGAADPSLEAYYTGPISCSDGSLPAAWGPSTVSTPFPNEELRLGSTGFWQYTQHLLLNDDQAPEVQFTGDSIFCLLLNQDCEGTVQIAFDYGDACVGASELDVRVEIDYLDDGENRIDISNFLDGNNLEAPLPIGQHRLWFRVDDNCGNVTEQDLAITIEDCSPPLPICQSTISVFLLPDAQDSSLAFATIFAEDLLLAPVFDCNGQGPLENENGQLEVTVFSLNFQGESPQKDQQELQLDCGDLDSNPMVEVHAWDASDQNNFCLSSIEVLDPQGYCPDSGEGFISGNVFTENQTPLPEVELRLSGREDRMMNTMMDGTYYFGQLTYGSDYSVRPELDLDLLNGVSTFDILLIQQHILGKLSIDSPYRLIAADVNNSGAISTLDLISLRKVILNVDVDFEENSSWRFIDADYDFQDPDNPWSDPFPEVININDLNSPTEQANFVGIKIGDVSGDAHSTPGVKTLSPRAKSSQLLYELDPKEGSRGLYNFWVDEDLQGLQLSMRIDEKQIPLIDFHSEFLDKNNWSFDQEQGIFRISWTSIDPIQTSPDEPLFTISAKDTGQGIPFQLESRTLSPEVYRNYSSSPLVMVEKSIEEPIPSVDQNFPNPFSTRTQIPIDLPTPQEVNLRVYDANGAIIYQKTTQFEAGKHLISLDGSALKGPGIYYYQIHIGLIQYQQRMIYF